MDWSNEFWIRLYTRDTGAWIALPWQARAVFLEILRKVNKAGQMPLDAGVEVEHLAGLIRYPSEVVEVGLSKLLKSDSVRLNDGTLTVKNYVVAQTATASGSQRQRQYRASKMTRGDIKETVTNESHVTQRHHLSQPANLHDIVTDQSGVTQRYDLSQNRRFESRKVTESDDQIRSDQTTKDQSSGRLSRSERARDPDPAAPPHGTAAMVQESTKPIAATEQAVEATKDTTPLPSPRHSSVVAVKRILAPEEQELLSELRKHPSLASISSDNDASYIRLHTFQDGCSIPLARQAIADLARDEAARNVKDIVTAPDRLLSQVIKYASAEKRKAMRIGSSWQQPRHGAAQVQDGDKKYEKMLHSDPEPERVLTEEEEIQQKFFPFLGFDHVRDAVDIAAGRKPWPRNKKKPDWFNVEPKESVS